MNLTLGNTTYVLVVLFLLLIDVILVHRLTRTPGFGEEERWIMKLFMATCICALSDALCIGVGAAAGQVGNYLLNAAFDLSTAYIAYFFFLLCAQRLGSSILDRQALQLAISTPIMVLTVLVMTSWATGLIFTILPDGTYVRGPLFALFVFVLANGYTVGAVLLAALHYLKEPTQERRRDAIEFILYIIPLTLGTIMQFFFTSTPSSSMGLTLTVLLVFMNNQQRLLSKKASEAEGANRAKSEFLSRMSHDVRTPINGIVGMIAIAKDHSSDRERVLACLDKIEVSAGSLLALVSDVLDLSKLENSGMVLSSEPFNVQKLCDDVLGLQKIIAAEKGVEIRMNCVDFPHPCVVGDAKHVRSVIINVLNNAIKYTNPGGSVTCSYHELNASDQHLIGEFVIEDTGIGMSEKFVEHMFEPFMQERSDARSTYQGTGLGLAIVKKTVDLMGGTVDVKSQQGVGTTFTISLPFDVAAGDTSADLRPVDLDLADRHFLIAEDNDLNLEIIQYVLEDAGAHVSVARNGQEAIDAFLRSQPGTFDAIIMDVMMPQVDGLEATRQIRVSPKADALSIPIVGMSANVFAEDIERARAAGMSDYVVKPVDRDKLAAALLKAQR